MRRNLTTNTLLVTAAVRAFLYLVQQKSFYKFSDVLECQVTAMWSETSLLYGNRRRYCGWEIRQTVNVVPAQCYPSPIYTCCEKSPGRSTS